MKERPPPIRWGPFFVRRSKEPSPLMVLYRERGEGPKPLPYVSALHPQLQKSSP